jgi:hypothetical protein
MTPALTPRCAQTFTRRRAWHATLAVALAMATLIVSGCAVNRVPVAIGQDGVPATMPPDLRACADWYAALDTQTELAGVRDAGATRIAGFPYARVDRFTSSLRDRVGNPLDDGPAGEVPPGVRMATLVARLLGLDVQARAIELANLPEPARAALPGAALASEPAALMQRLHDCGARWAVSDLASPARMADLMQALVVPDDYVTGYRVVGLYALSRLPFAMGTQRFEAERRAVFAREGVPDGGTDRLRWSPPLPHLPPGANTPAIVPVDALGVPAPGPDQLDQLFAQFAPVFDLGVAGDDDRPGALVWRPGTAPGEAPQVAVNPAAPVVYRHLDHTRYGTHSLLQLVYTLWFPARTRTKPLDLLAGQLDGLVFRVTLAPDGTPLIYDSIHPCGCYHMFFPTPAARPKPPPTATIEWAFVPQTLPGYDPRARLVVHVAAGTHYIDHIRVASPGDNGAYALRDYDELRSLPTSPASLAPAARRSAFDPDGFIAGTDRAESWLFWPMGIARAGTMRQAGRQATAFVGRRHFDDADLMEKRFEFDQRHFGRR